ncbi:MAG TPA: RHS repeat-associated core domain-containing protein [Thermoanaerobaculia bacterium]|jgi:RHS repeat-associated protein|nr:RHS repeat-associated core domain-containing protein [Thermoanaerobaculia bacterium]
MIRRVLLLVLAVVTCNAAAFAQGCPSGASWCSGTYAYDAMGNIRAIGADTYIYDTAGRLVSGTADLQRTGILSRQDYGYDTFGNRTSASRVAGSVDCLGGCEQSPAIDPVTNHITGNGAVYDAAGNLISITNTVNNTSFTSTYVYDSAGSMAQATAGSDVRQFIYTADDERIATRNGQSWTWTVRALDNKVLREFTSLEPNGSPGLPTTARQWSKDYVWRDGLLLASVSASTSGPPITEHFHLDHLGTPRLVSNDNGVQMAIHAYYPFDAELNLSSETPVELMKFTGHERDQLASNPNTLDYMHARYEMGTMGRFLSVDPNTEFDKASREPQLWNRYLYGVASPLMYFDPDGRANKIYLLSMLPSNRYGVGESVSDLSRVIADTTNHTLDVRLGLTEATGLSRFKNVDATDYVILESHGGGPNFQSEARNGSRETFTDKDIVSSLNKSKALPSAIILAGCSTQEAAQHIATSTGVMTFGTTGTVRSEEGSRAATVLAHALAETGSVKFALEVANQIIKTPVCHGENCQVAQFVVFGASH